MKGVNGFLVLLLKCNETYLLEKRKTKPGTPAAKEPPQAIRAEKENPVKTKF
ncbi:hypothetical protein Barb7_02383 [Bacteroidales bacterium Barb7]|nr:hypothetical protein Barb7_02383 [Bacteroidales bacterium Barb7]